MQPTTHQIGLYPDLALLAALDAALDMTRQILIARQPDRHELFATDLVALTIARHADSLRDLIDLYVLALEHERADTNKNDDDIPF